MFIGQYSQVIDDKNRFIIPLKFREAIGQNAYITIGYDKCLSIYTEEGFEKLQQKLSEFSDSKTAFRMHVRAITANALECKSDSHGRVTLTSNLISLADIKHDIVIIGNLDHIEIWSKEAWDEYNKNAIESFDALAEENF